MSESDVCAGRDCVDRSGHGHPHRPAQPSDLLIWRTVFSMSAPLTLTSDDSREGYMAKGARRVPRFEGK